MEHFSKVAEKQVEISDLVKYIIKYMMDKGVKLDNTEGMIEASVFPVNYFTLKQVRACANHSRTAESLLVLGGLSWHVVATHEHFHL